MAPFLSLFVCVFVCYCLSLCLYSFLFIFYLTVFYLHLYLSLFLLSLASLSLLSPSVSWTVVAHVIPQDTGAVALGEEVDVTQRDIETVVVDHGHEPAHHHQCFVFHWFIKKRKRTTETTSIKTETVRQRHSETIYYSCLFVSLYLCILPRNRCGIPFHPLLSG